MNYEYKFTYTAAMYFEQEQELYKLKHGLSKNFFKGVSLIFGVLLGVFAATVFLPALINVYSTQYVFYVLIPILLFITSLPIIVEWITTQVLELIKNARGFKLPIHDETEWQVTMSFNSKGIVWKTKQVTMRYLWTDVVKICDGSTFDCFYSRHDSAFSLPISCHNNEEERRQLLAWCHETLEKLST